MTSNDTLHRIKDYNFNISKITPNYYADCWKITKRLSTQHIMYNEKYYPISHLKCNVIDNSTNKVISSIESHVYLNPFSVKPQAIFNKLSKSEVALHFIITIDTERGELVELPFIKLIPKDQSIQFVLFEPSSTSPIRTLSLTLESAIDTLIDFLTHNFYFNKHRTVTAQMNDENSELSRSNQPSIDNTHLSYELPYNSLPLFNNDPSGNTTGRQIDAIKVGFRKNLSNQLGVAFTVNGQETVAETLLYSFNRGVANYIIKAVSESQPFEVRSKQVKDILKDVVKENASCFTVTAHFVEQASIADVLYLQFDKNVIRFYSNVHYNGNLIVIYHGELNQEGYVPSSDMPLEIIALLMSLDATTLVEYLQQVSREWTTHNDTHAIQGEGKVCYRVDKGVNEHTAKALISSFNEVYKEALTLEPIFNELPVINVVLTDRLYRGNKLDYAYHIHNSNELVLTTKLTEIGVKKELIKRVIFHELGHYLYHTLLNTKSITSDSHTERLNSVMVNQLKLDLICNEIKNLATHKTASKKIKDEMLHHVYNKNTEVFARIFEVYAFEQIAMKNNITFIHNQDTELELFVGLLDNITPSISKS